MDKQKCWGKRKRKGFIQFREERWTESAATLRNDQSRAMLSKIYKHPERRQEIEGRKGGSGHRSPHSLPAFVQILSKQFRLLPVHPLPGTHSSLSPVGRP